MSDFTNQSVGQNVPAHGEDAAIDQMLRTAFLARPEPIPPGNLAARAIQHANTLDPSRARRHAQHLARQRWWAQLTAVAATLLVSGMIVLGGYRLWSHGDISALASSSFSVAESNSSTTTEADSFTTISSTNTIAIILVGGGLLIALVMLTLPRSSPISEWAPESLAGF